MAHSFLNIFFILAYFVHIIIVLSDDLGITAKSVEQTSIDRLN